MLGGIQRPYPQRFRLYKGEFWHVLHRSFCEYAVRSPDNVARSLSAYFTGYRISDESYFQTLACHPEVRDDPNRNERNWTKLNEIEQNWTKLYEIERNWTKLLQLKTHSFVWKISKWLNKNWKWFHRSIYEYAVRPPDDVARLFLGREFFFGCSPAIPRWNNET